MLSTPCNALTIGCARKVVQDSGGPLWGDDGLLGEVAEVPLPKSGQRKHVVHVCKAWRRAVAATPVCCWQPEVICPLTALPERKQLDQVQR